MVGGQTGIVVNGTVLSLGILRWKRLMVNGSDGRELASLLVSYWAPEIGFCLSFCHRFLCDAKPLKSDFLKTITNGVFHIFLEAQPQP